MFQFLIGTVKTGQGMVFFCLYPVSIPHRYCKNKDGIELTRYFVNVSIPHRYCKNYAQELTYYIA